MEEKKTTELAILTPATLKQDYSVVNCLKTFKDVRSVSQAIEINTPTIGRVSRELGERELWSYIKEWLVKLDEMLNLKRGLTDNDMAYIGFYIVNDFRNLTMADMFVIFTNAIKGEYGEFYESLSIPKVVSWFTKYEKDRIEAFALLSQRENQSHKYRAERNNKPEAIRDSVMLDSNDFKQLKNK